MSSSSRTSCIKVNTMIKYIAILISVFTIIISASEKKWTYVDKLGHDEYCCFCDKDFVKTDVIDECFIKNKNDRRLPFCRCYKGRYPKCPKSTIVCNRKITCPNETRLAYKRCSVPFLNDAKLVCNDSLLWEQHFTCPECPENVTVCNREISCPKRLYDEECKVPSMNNSILVCNDSLQWQQNFTCPECPENTTICNKQITCPERHYNKECVVPFTNKGKLVCGDNLKWKSNFRCPVSVTESSSNVGLILACVFSTLLIFAVVGIIVYVICKRRRKSGQRQNQEDEEVPLSTTDSGGNDGNNAGNIVPGQNQENGGPNIPHQNGNPGGNAGNNAGNNIPGQNQENGGPNIPQQNGNPGGNAGNNAGNNIPVPNADRPVISSNSEDDDEADSQPLLSVTSGIEETGSNSGYNSGNEDNTVLIRERVDPYEHNLPFGVAESLDDAQPSSHTSQLYNPGPPNLPVPSLSPESIQGIGQFPTAPRLE